MTFNFNLGWKVFVGDPAGAQAPEFNDGDWKSVTLPYAWNEDDAFRVAIDKHPTGIAWYRKRFRLPAEAAGRKVFLEFEGVRQAGEFYLNGEFIGLHENGVMAVGLDVTEAVLHDGQENVIAVRTDNDWNYREKATGQKYQWADRNFNANYGGIPKNVKLHVADLLHQTLPLYSNLRTTGVYVHATEIDVPSRTATITAESEVRNDDTKPRAFDYEFVLVDLEGNVIKRGGGASAVVGPGKTVTVTAAAFAEGLQFWSWGFGYLYDVYTILKAEGAAIDVVRTRTGFRKTEFGNGIVKLNDRVIQFKGYAQRTSNEWPAMGLAVPPWLSDFSNRLMVEGNGNLVRWMHVTPSKQDVESCDRVGLMQAMPPGDAERDVGGRRWGQRLELMRDAVIYNRNNPSILFYEAGNKGVSEEHMSEIKLIRDTYDPHGGRAVGSREMLDSRVAEYGGEMLYINKSARLPFWAMEYSRDEGLRKYWDEFSPPFHLDGDGPLYKDKPAREYNRNQDSHAIEDITRWFDYWRERPGTGRRVSSGGVNIIFSDSNTHYRGAENYRRSGEVDPMRIPKDGFWAHQVMWDGWVDVEHPRAHIFGHWNYEPTTQKDVYVVSSADAVELFLDGESLGKGIQTNRFLFTFPDIKWKPGTLLAVGYNKAGQQVCEAVKATSGEPFALRLISHTDPGGLKADGADVALVEVEVVDKEGRRCPTALNMVDFELTGPAEWRGGIAQGPDNYILSKSLPVECGVNRILIRSLPEPGRIILRARSSGLEPAQVRLTSKPVSVQHGLTTSFPADGTVPFLGRGETPPGPSFRVTRLDVPIVSALAGANAADAIHSYDDNERTNWSNSNRLASAWISYELARPATLHEAVLKLRSWRTRSYPLRVTVDDEEVYRGVTPRSLGYVTLPLSPVNGQRVKIELISKSEARDGFNITELQNEANAETGDPRQGRGTLSIVEAEFYEAVNR